MRVEDLVIEVRDSSLARQGIIFARDAEIEATVPANGVGTWILRLPGQHHLSSLLTTPGAGVVVTDVTTGVVLFSGPMTSAKETEDTENSAVNTLEVSGVTDDVILQDRLAYTDPLVPDIGEDAENAYYIRTDKAENLLHHFVSVNAGPEALPERRVRQLLLEGNAGRGSTVTKEVRFPTLLELSQEIAQQDGLGFMVRQRGASLVFRTFASANRTREVRLSVRNERLKSSSVQIEPPGVTRVIVAAQDNKAGYVPVDSPLSVDAENAWSRRIEQFATGNSKSSLELEQVGMEYLNEAGFTNVAAQAVAVDHEHLTYGIDWELGDRVTVEIGGDELTSQVTGFSLMVTGSNGLQFGMTLGDATGFNLTTSILKKLKEATRRIAALERVPPVDEITTVPEYKTFTFATATRVWECQHALNQKPVQVTTLDQNGDELMGDVDFVTPNTVRISWFYPTAGTARIQR